MAEQGSEKPQDHLGFEPEPPSPKEAAPKPVDPPASVPPAPAVFGRTGENNRSDVPPAGLDLIHLVKTGFGVIRSPLHGIEENRSPYASQRTIEGGFYCGLFLLVYVLLFLFRGSNDVSWWSYTLGGMLFVGAGIAGSTMLRRFLGKVQSADTSDDVLALGAALLFPAAGALLRAILVAPGVNILVGVGEAVYLCGVLLAAFTHAGSLSRVGRVREEEAVLLTVLTLAAAQLVAGMLGFRLI
jgi:hypothetical protein